MYALVDGNNFFVSCERIFRPSLNHRPVVVLSNNDGCVIARSQEAKALGIKMAQPWFQCENLVDKCGLVALSANFTLYGDISSRMMSLAAGLGYEQEIYSIDECFVALDGIQGDLTKRASIIRARILQWVGIPCGIGIGQTKTLAKLANHIAKEAERHTNSYPSELAHVCNLANASEQQMSQLLIATPVQDIWGIGRKIAKQLNDHKIYNAYQFVNMNLATLKRHWSISLEKTARELRGQPCIELENIPQKKQISCTRSFGKSVTQINDLIEAVSEFSSRAAEKLREQRSVAGQVYVFIHTSPFRKGKQCAVGVSMPMHSTNNTSTIITTAIKALKSIFKQGYDWAKAGVILMDIQDQDILQCELDFCFQSKESNINLMQAVDEINDRYGRNCISVASTGVSNSQRSWGMKQGRKTPNYTTNWDEVPTVKA